MLCVAHHFDENKNKVDFQGYFYFNCFLDNNDAIHGVSFFEEKLIPLKEEEIYGGKIYGTFIRKEKDLHSLQQANPER
jgi:hypothetical protein